MKSFHATSGQPIVFQLATPYRWECCDCGLVHLVVINKDKGNVVVTMFRDEFETGVSRCQRKMKRARGNSSRLSKKRS